jgi:hypothetical protein
MIVAFSVFILSLIRLLTNVVGAIRKGGRPTEWPVPPNPWDGAESDAVMGAAPAP